MRFFFTFAIFLAGCFMSHEAIESPYEGRAARAIPPPCSDLLEDISAACNVTVHLNHLARERGMEIGCWVNDVVLYAPLRDVGTEHLDMMWVLEESERLASAETCDELLLEPPLTYAEQP